MWELILKGQIDGQEVEQVTCCFCQLHFGPLKIHTIENLNPITKTQLTIRDKNNNYSISQYEDKETLIGDWAKAVLDSKVTRKTQLYNSNDSVLFYLFIEAVTSMGVTKNKEIFESYMLIKDYDGKYKAPDLEKFTTFNVEKSEGKYIYKPWKDDTPMFNYKRTEILRLNEFSELEELIRKFARSEIELSIYKTLICWTLTGMIKKQLIDIGFGLFPAMVLIGEKKTGKSTAMKTFCDLGIQDYCKTGNNIRETTIKNLFNTTFPVMFDEISNVNFEVLDIFKSGLTQGFIYTEKGKKTGAGGESFVHRKINPFIFSANTLTIPDEALMRRLITIDYPKQLTNNNNISLLELQSKMKSFYKMMFIDIIPKWLTNNNLNTFRKKLIDKDERMLYLKFGEELLSSVDMLKNVNLFHDEHTIETGGVSIVQEVDLIFTDIKRVIQSVEYYDKKDDLTYNAKLVLRDNVCPPNAHDKFNNIGIYFLKAKEKDKILISSEILPKLDNKIKNKYKNMAQLSKVLEKEMKTPIVETSVGTTSKYGIIFNYSELFEENKEDNNGIEKEELE